MERRHWIGVGAVLAVAALAGAWFGGRPPQPPPVEVVPAGTEAAAGRVTVHVSGAVARSGLVALAAGSLVADAVAAAGGATPAADLTAINLAGPVRDGDHLVVPVRGADGGMPGHTVDGRIRVNSASALELERLPGVGSVTAGRIIAHREEHGPCKVVEDLLDVPGIGEGKLAAMRDAVIVP